MGSGSTMGIPGWVIKPIAGCPTITSLTLIVQGFRRIELEDLSSRTTVSNTRANSEAAHMTNVGSEYLIHQPHPIDFFMGFAVFDLVQVSMHALFLR